MILVIVQARVSSSRLPGKVIRPLLGKPMILRQIERLKRIKQLDKLILATSTDPSDDRLAEVCVRDGIECFRGNLDDVLDRFYQAALQYRPDYIVRLTGDCPLADPELIDEVISFTLKGSYDYGCNCLEPTYPDGLDVEMFRFSCLETAWKEATLPSQRQHVTPFIIQQTDRFRIACMKNDIDLSSLRWTVDELADFDLITLIYEALYSGIPEFVTVDILNLLKERPYLQKLNSAINRNEGYAASLLEDAEITSDKELIHEKNK